MTKSQAATAVASSRPMKLPSSAVKRKTVRFEEDANRRVKRRIQVITHVLESAQKSDLWIQPSDVAETLQTLRQNGESVRHTKAFEPYAAVLTKTYLQVTPATRAQITELAHGLARGMEPFALPELAMQRAIRRREGIHGVLCVHKLIKAVPQADVVLGDIAANLSSGSRRFAQAVGAADAAAAVQQQLPPLSRPPDTAQEEEDAPQTSTIVLTPSTELVATASATIDPVQPILQVV